jgi:diguanylate cyclase (GGDEF)-like protein
MDDRDVLTGLPRKKSFLNRVTEQLDARLSGRRYHAEGNADYLAVISPDRFRDLNMIRGHLLGDSILLALTRILAETLREGDRLFRLGGKEFAAIIYDLSPDEVAEVCERIRARVESAPIVEDIGMTVSLGYAPMSGHILPKDALDDAQRALASAKAQGRNRACAAEAADDTVGGDGDGTGKGIELF